VHAYLALVEQLELALLVLLDRLAHAAVGFEASPILDVPKHIPDPHASSRERLTRVHDVHGVCRLGAGQHFATAATAAGAPEGPLPRYLALRSRRNVNHRDHHRDGRLEHALPLAAPLCALRLQPGAAVGDV